MRDGCFRRKKIIIFKIKYKINQKHFREEDCLQNRKSKIRGEKKESFRGGSGESPVS